MLVTAVVLLLLLAFYANLAVTFRDCPGPRADSWRIEYDLTYTDGLLCERRALLQELWRRVT